MLRRYQEAISYYEKALALSSRSVSTYAGLAYTHHLQVGGVFIDFLFFYFYVRMSTGTVFDIIVPKPNYKICT